MLQFAQRKHPCNQPAGGMLVFEHSCGKAPCLIVQYENLLFDRDNKSNQPSIQNAYLLCTKLFFFELRFGSPTYFAFPISHGVFLIIIRRLTGTL